MICPRCESFAALVGELTLDRDHLRNELNKRKGDIVTTNNPGVVEQIRAVLNQHGFDPGTGYLPGPNDRLQRIRRIIDSPPAATGTTIEQEIARIDAGWPNTQEQLDAYLTTPDSPPSAQEQPASTPATTTPPASATESPATEGAKEGTCDHCGHSFIDNQHGLDQNDIIYDDETSTYMHRGYCTYCKTCRHVAGKINPTTTAPISPTSAPLPAANAGESKVAELEQRVRDLESTLKQVEQWLASERRELATANSELERLRGVNRELVSLYTAWRSKASSVFLSSCSDDLREFVRYMDALSRATPPAPPRDKGMAETQGQGEVQS